MEFLKYSKTRYLSHLLSAPFIYGAFIGFVVFDLFPFTSKDIPALNPQVPLEAAAAAAWVAIATVLLAKSAVAAARAAT